MAPRKTAKAATKALSRGNPPTRRKQASASLLDGFPIRTVAVVIGVAGLAALGIALFGPRRFQDEIVRPLTAATLVPLAAAVTPQADRVWAETRPWRNHAARVLNSINTAEVRDQIVERLNHWVDRLR
ncbi:MAG TPA: hypothetical protein VHZ78_06180 [Rhizomicrobium sp.]|jgi:hypothetical protein|nr:hypothetical protein [Rhizomicrobium sp.]